MANRPAEIFSRRALLVLLILCSVVPPVFYYRHAETPLYNTRFYGFHPMEVLLLLWFGHSTAYLPLLFLAGLVLSVLRPASANGVLVICTSIFILSLLFHLILTYYLISLMALHI